MTNTFGDSLCTLLTQIGVRPYKRRREATNELSDIEKSLGIQIPSMLATFDRLLGGHHFTRCHDQFLPHKKWQMRNDALVFAEENQGVVFWGIRRNETLRTDDPPVVQGNPDSERWYAESRRLSTFLLRAVCWQAVNCGMKYLHDVSLTRTEAKRRFADIMPFCPPESRPERDMDTFVTKGLCVCVAYHHRNALIKIGGHTKALVRNFCNVYGLPEYDEPNEIAWF